MLVITALDFEDDLQHHARWLAEGRPGDIPVKGMNYIDVHINGIELTNRNLSFSAISNSLFSNCTFRNCHLDVTYMIFNTFQNCQFISCDMTKTQWLHCNLLFVNFTDSNFKKAMIFHSNLSYADLTKSKLTLTHFLDSDLRFVDFSCAALAETIFDDSKLIYQKPSFVDSLEDVRLIDCEVGSGLSIKKTSDSHQLAEFLVVDREKCK
jgi:uncharacterized protein YjbI with pentapeptide repeats